MKRDNLFSDFRNSRMAFNEIYFWTDTIYEWKKLLSPDIHKQIIIDCWRELVKRKLIAIYAFVIMPNHIHVLWEMLEPNGKEMPHASFNKFTSHRFLDNLRANHPHVLPLFRVNEKERRYRFWQRDALAVLIDNEPKAYQKLSYIHTNPLQERWSLVQYPEDYIWSSARYYETGEDAFGFLTHYQERFG